MEGLTTRPGNLMRASEAARANTGGKGDRRLDFCETHEAPATVARNHGTRLLAALLTASYASAPLADAVMVVVPVPLISSGPLCVMFPVVAVAVRSPPTVEAAKFNPASFTTVAAPVP